MAFDGLDTSLRFRHGMVTSVDTLATSAGVALLTAGGSAVDAALAANAVLTVTGPHLCGLGGDLFAMVHDGAGPPACLDASGHAGSGADAERLRADGHRRIPPRGHIAAVPVPGCVDGWMALHDRFGRRPIGEVLAPAIDASDSGFPASPLLALMADDLVGVRGAEELAAAAAGPGTLVRRPGVARALRAVVDEGRDGFYGGEFGAGLLALGGGEFHPSDLAESHARWVEPLSVRALGHDVWTAPPTSQGYLTLLGLAISEDLPLPEDCDAPLWAHLLVESARAAGWDRPDRLHEGADVAPLLADAEVRRRRAGIDPDRRTERPGPAAGGGTMHLCAADRHGQAVSLIQSNASGFGAHLAVGDTGILVHDRGIGFSLRPGHPAEYGPRRRPPHTLAPALVTLPDGALHAVVGTMGGDSQPQILLQLLTRMLRHGHPPGPAIRARRWALGAHGGMGFDAWDDVVTQEVLIEAGADSWAEGLRQRGHPVARRPWGLGFGHAQVIVAEPHGWAGAADPRAVIGAAAGH